MKLRKIGSEEGIFRKGNSWLKYLGIIIFFVVAIIFFRSPLKFGWIFGVLCSLIVILLIFIPMIRNRIISK